MSDNRQFWLFAAIHNRVDKRDKEATRRELDRHCSPVWEPFEADDLISFKRGVLAWVVSNPAAPTYFEKSILAKAQTAWEAEGLPATAELGVGFLNAYLRSTQADIVASAAAGDLGISLGVGTSSPYARILTAPFVKWLDNPQFLKPCRQCSVPFHGRSDAKFCTPSCRATFALSKMIATGTADQKPEDTVRQVKEVHATLRLPKGSERLADD